MAEFGVQLGLWLLAAVASAIAISEYLRLPKACQWIDLDARVAKLKAVLDDLTTKTQDANQLLARRDVAAAEAQELSARISNDREQLLMLVGERQRQEVLRQELAALQEKLNIVQADHQRLTTENTQLAATNTGLAQRNAAAETDFKSLTERHRSVQTELQGLEARTEQLRNELASGMARLQELTHAANKRQQEFDQLGQELVVQGHRRLGLEQDLARLEQACAGKEKEVQSVQATLADLTRQRDELQARNTALKSEIEQRTNDSASLQQTLDRLRKHLDDLNHQLAEAKKAVADADAKLIGLRSEKTALESAIASLKAISERLAKELDRAGVGEVADRYRDLWMPLPFPSLPPAKSPADEKAALQRTAEYIRGRRLKFHDRVLYAFHTALKTNDISPLVVLAGISGTGKSELPQRYAEGMGMHFVMLAVQPRWDSPQDLFGFYNYLERRYKATELARAMVQFEQYNHTDWKFPIEQGSRRNDRMLLVLLDEMNLARVEYYFSEFLSKLEKRRGLDRTDPKKRAVAEIALEMGSLVEGERPIRLFPEQNVLFTGTMNEDESTQALSDKVLDRACVMRFGRPRDAEQPTNGSPVQATEAGLSYKTWQSWTKPPAGGEVQSVSEWVNTINSAMEEIHRPFGHRVAQAIQCYVANYPGWVQDRVKVAMADQIEQRILPKLRGVDVDESRGALDHIGKVVQDLGDEHLIHAFKTGYEGQSTFIWRGVDRTED